MKYKYFQTHISGVTILAFKGIFRQNNGKNIKMILCTQIKLK
jgi:hypothetical protein